MVSADLSIVVSIKFNSNRICNSRITHSSSDRSYSVGDGINNEYKSISTSSILISNTSWLRHAKREDSGKRSLESIRSSKSNGLFQVDRTSLIGA